METVVSVGGACPTSSKKGGDASRNPKSAIQPSAFPPPVTVRTFFSYNVSIVLIFAATHFGMISAQSNDVSKFRVKVTNYSCSSNLICLGEAHEYIGDEGSGIQIGQLSLTDETYNPNEDNKGLAYYREPVKLLDRSTRQPASFNTTFAVAMRYGSQNNPLMTGHGMTFVISADNSTVGASGPNLGIFSENTSTTTFKSIVVEFDSYLNNYPPINDISDNHVSIDFMNITWRAAANASDVNVSFGNEFTFYAWVEYSYETEQLEVRVSYGESRPGSPLLNYTVNLFDSLEEYMWVGFSSGGGGSSYSNHYIGDWEFISWFGAYASTPVPRGGKSRNKTKALILGTALAVPVFLLACIVIGISVLLIGGGRHYRHCQLWSGYVNEEDELTPIEGIPERFSYEQLSVATGHFNGESKLGQGGFGSVYRGVLPSSGIPVAVKKINSDSAQGEKEFMAEISIISQLRHRNLIQLLGWCKDMTREKYLLVYELMPNGSLDKLLFPGPGPAEKEASCLSWQQRLNVVTGTAAALDYLHRGWTQQVIHRDIKSSNIMLDGEWNTKLGDFGLARLVDHQRVAETTGVAGTYGYIAPEAAATGHFTDKTDVFAFGAVVLEVTCGRKAFVPYLSSEEMVLVDWVWRSLSKGNLLSTVDKRLGNYDAYWMEVVLILGLLCSHPNPLARPSMRQVVEVLAGDVPVPSIPASKPAEFSSEPQNTFSIDDLHSSRLKSTSKCESGSISFVFPTISDSIQEHTGKPQASSSNPTSSPCESNSLS